MFNQSMRVRVGKYLHEHRHSDKTLTSYTPIFYHGLAGISQQEVCVDIGLVYGHITMYFFSESNYAGTYLPPILSHDS